MRILGPWLLLLLLLWIKLRSCLCKHAGGKPVFLNLLWNPNSLFDVFFFDMLFSMLVGRVGAHETFFRILFLDNFYRTPAFLAGLVESYSASLC